MYPVRRISADVVKRCLVERYFPAYGIRQSIVSDNAAVFKSRTFCDLCFAWGIRHVTTSSYYPQASHVEHFNRNLKVALTIYHHAHHTSGDENLAALTLAFNSAWHESTAATPASLFLGRDLNHPLGLKWKLFNLGLDKDQKSMEDYWDQVLSHLRKARAKVADWYKVGRRPVDFRVGDFVLLRTHPLSSRAQQRSAKLDFKWSTSLTIAKFVSPVTVQLANPDTGVIVRRAHVTQLKRHFRAEEE
jgi:hypothetical protein